MSIQLSNVIRVWRRGVGLTLKEAAREIGIPFQTLHRFENGVQQVGGGRDGQGGHKGERPAQAGNGTDGKTLAAIMRWLLDHSADIDSGVVTAHDKQRKG